MNEVLADNFIFELFVLNMKLMNTLRSTSNLKDQVYGLFSLNVDQFL